MYIRELTINEFKEFAKNNPLSTFHQTQEYALLKAEHGYEYEIIGYGDSENLYAAAVVLVKLLNGYLYAYIPDGFLIDYTNEFLLHDFTNALYSYYKKEEINFIKINPPIVIGEIDPKTHAKKYNESFKITKNLQKNGFIKLNDNIYFESILPRINVIVDLDDFTFENLSKNVKNKIRRGIRRGLKFEKGDINKLPILHSFIKNKTHKDDFYYSDYFNVFSRSNMIDFFLISIDYEQYIYNSQAAYYKEELVNSLLNKKVIDKPVARNINKKMNSDKTLLAYKNDIAYASKKLNENQKEYIAGALVIKYKDTVTIVINGYDKKYKEFAPNYYLFYEILNYYKNEYKFANLNGITGDFSKNNKYHGLNTFKLGFKPKIYEYIGEFDLVINERRYNNFIKKGLLQKEFKNDFYKKTN